jgi:hypothetical protein
LGRSSSGFNWHLIRFRSKARHTYIAHSSTVDQLCEFRALPDADKLRVYVRIVRLLLEEEDSVQAETYYNRAALLIHSTTDKETVLQFKLCSARIMDYARRFLEAAGRYHELSYVGEIDEGERLHMLYGFPPPSSECSN